MKSADFSIADLHLDFSGINGLFDSLISSEAESAIEKAYDSYEGKQKGKILETTGAIMKDYLLSKDSLKVLRPFYTNSGFKEDPFDF